MKSIERIEILSRCRLPLIWMNLCNKNGVYIRNYKIPNLIVCLMLATPIFYGFVMYLWLCVENNFDLVKLARTFACIVGNIKAILIFFSLAWTNPMIIKMIDHLQAVVDRSTIRFEIY